MWPQYTYVTVNAIFFLSYIVFTILDESLSNRQKVETFIYSVAITSFTYFLLFKGGFFH